MKVGLVSDTHGLLRPELFDLFDGVERILHAGDVGDEEILDDLAAIAPVTAVWGNVDGESVRRRTREQAELECDGVRVVLVHGHGVADPDELPGLFPDADVVVHGHTHVPRCERVGGLWLVNPGSAGPRRIDRPVTAAVAELRPDGVRVRHHDLLLLAGRGGR